MYDNETAAQIVGKWCAVRSAGRSTDCYVRAVEEAFTGRLRWCRTAGGCNVSVWRLTGRLRWSKTAGGNLAICGRLLKDCFRSVCAEESSSRTDPSQRMRLKRNSSLGDLEYVPMLLTPVNPTELQVASRSLLIYLFIFGDGNAGMRVSDRP
ncbi:g5420 [Coccomyxa elongata]